MKLEYKLYYIEWLDAMVFLPKWGKWDEITEWDNNNEGLVKQVSWIIEEKYFAIIKNWNNKFG